MQLALFTLAADCISTFRERLIRNFVWGYVWVGMMALAPSVGLYGALTLKRGALLAAMIQEVCLLPFLTPFMVWADQAFQPA